MPSCCTFGQAGGGRAGRPADLIVVDGDPLADIALLDGQGETCS